MIVYLAIGLCAVLLALMIYRYDMYEREPWYTLLLALALGYGAMWAMGHLEDLSIHWLKVENSIAGQAAVAATHEEVTKLLLVVLIALGLRMHFNDPMDGLIYGAFVGLGMGVEESVFYLSFERDPHISVVGTEAVRLILHLLLGGISGFAVGMARFRKPFWPLVLLGGLAASMTLHFLWDYLIGLPLAMTWMSQVNELEMRLASIGLMITTMFVFGVCVLIGGRWSREHFEPGSEREVWGWWPFSSKKTGDD